MTLLTPRGTKFLQEFNFDFVSLLFSYNIKQVNQGLII